MKHSVVVTIEELNRALNLNANDTLCVDNATPGTIRITWDEELPVQAPVDPVPEPPKSYTIKMRSIDLLFKIEAIKMLRSLIPFLDLKETKRMIDSCVNGEEVTILVVNSRVEANEICTKLARVGISAYYVAT